MERLEFQLLPYFLPTVLGGWWQRDGEQSAAFTGEGEPGLFPQWLMWGGLCSFFERFHLKPQSGALWWPRGVGQREGREAQEGGDLCISMAHPHCWTAETSITLQKLKNSKNKSILKKEKKSDVGLIWHFPLVFFSLFLTYSVMTWREDRRKFTLSITRRKELSNIPKRNTPETAG